MKRRFLLVLAITLLVVASGAAGGAASPPVGTGKTSISIFTLTTQDLAVNYAVSLAFGSGVATTDPPRNGAGFNFANLDLTGASVGEESLVKVRSSADADDSNDVKRADPDPEGSGEPASIEGCVGAPEGGNLFECDLTREVGGVKVTSGKMTIKDRTSCANHPTVCPQEVFAKLGQATMDVDVLEGTVVFEGVSFDVLDKSHEPLSSAAQGIEVKKIDLLPLSKILEFAGLSIDDLIELADLLDESGETSEAAKGAKKTLLDAVNTLVEPDLPEDTSAEDVIAKAKELMALEQDAHDTLGLGVDCSTDPPPAACPVAALLQPLVDDFESKVDALRTALGAITVLTIEDFKARVEAASDGANPTASAKILGIGTMKVFGQTVTAPEGVGEKQVDDLIDAAVAQMNTTVAEVKKVLESLGVTINEWDADEETGIKDGVYRFGQADLTPLGLTVKINPTWDFKLMTLSAYAEHKPAVVDPPPPGLANTGPEQLWIVAGMVLLGAGVLLFRSIRGA